MPRSTPSRPAIRSVWGRRRISSAPTPIWPARTPAGPPARRWSSTAVTRRLDPAHEDLGEGLGHGLGGEPAARFEPQVGVVVHSEPAPGGQPRIDVAELPRLDPRPQHALHPVLVFAAPQTEPLRPLPRQGRELV